MGIWGDDHMIHAYAVEEGIHMLTMVGGMWKARKRSQKKQKKSLTSDVEMLYLECRRWRKPLPASSAPYPKGNGA